MLYLRAKSLRCTDGLYIKVATVEPTTSRSLEELYQSLLEQAADADIQGHYLAVNRSECEMLSYTREEILHLMNLKTQDA